MIKSETLLTKGFTNYRNVYRFLSLLTNSNTVDCTSGIFLIQIHWENLKPEALDSINPNHARFAAGERLNVSKGKEREMRDKDVCLPANTRRWRMIRSWSRQNIPARERNGIEKDDQFVYNSFTIVRNGSLIGLKIWAFWALKMKAQRKPR